jgi:hypothetical protein
MEERFSRIRSDMLCKHGEATAPGSPVIIYTEREYIGILCFAIPGQRHDPFSNRDSIPGSYIRYHPACRSYSAADAGNHNPGQHRWNGLRGSTRRQRPFPDILSGYSAGHLLDHQSIWIDIGRN